MTRLLMLLIVGCSCGPEIPGNPVRDAPPTAQAGIDYVWAAYEAEFDDLGTPPPITWVTGPCLDITSEPDECVKGLHVQHGDEVWLVYADRPHQSFMAHEFLHSALLRTAGCGDAEHKDPRWELAAEIKVSLREGGL